MLPMPPPGFDALTVEEQIGYVQSLWDYIAAHPAQVPCLSGTSKYLQNAWLPTKKTQVIRKQRHGAIYRLRGYKTGAMLRKKNIL